MSIVEHKIILIALSVGLVLAVSLPFVQQTLISEKSSFNSELWLLGQQHTTDNYPSSITPNQNYTIFLDIKNNMGKTVQYMIQMKFLNKTQLTTASSIPCLYSTTAVVKNEEIWALPVFFSIDYYRTASQINLKSINFNDITVNATNCSIAWDPEREGFFGYLYFELWIYNSSTGSFQNHDCSVDLRLTLNT